MTIHAVARFIAKPDSVNELRHIVINLVSIIRKDGGCLRCNLVNSTTNPNEFTFIEEWSNQAAIDAHLADPMIKSSVENAAPLLSAPLELSLYTAVEQ